MPTYYNYARTLLMNVSQQDRYCPGEELIPLQYVPLQLPSYLQVLRKTLFGLSPDRLMLNYRTRQLLSLVHGTELQQYVLRLDPRITYDLTQEKLFDPQIFVPVATRQSNALVDPDEISAEPTLRVEGSPASPDFSGLCRYQFRVVNEGSASSPAYRIDRVLPMPGSEILNPVFSSGFSTAMPLRGTGYSVKTTSPSTAYSWTIDILLRPTLSLPALASSLQRLNPDILNQLFLPTSDGYKTFHACWLQHPDFAYRLGGLVMAVIYRTHELHQVTQEG